jgi:hypothetical protein
MLNSETWAGKRKKEEEEEMLWLWMLHSGKHTSDAHVKNYTQLGTQLNKLAFISYMYLQF